MTIASPRGPFLDVQSFVHEMDAEVPAPRPTMPAWSPFLSVYESSDGENLADEPLREAYASLVNDLYDEEFDESLFELLTSARSLHEEHLSSGHSRGDADRIVTQHFSQLIREAESMVDAMARELGTRETVAVDRELDEFADRYTSGASLEPEFQDFLGKLIKKIGKGVKAVAKVAVKGITTLGLGPILARIKPLLRPLLNQVLQKAIGRLPASVQPIATQLAQRLGLAPKPPAPAPPPAPSGSGEPPAVEPPAAAGAPDAAAVAAPVSEPPPGDPGSPVQPAAGGEVTDMQQELDQLIAEAMLSDDEVEMELEFARVRAASNGAAPPVFANLDDAREQFIQALENLKEGENPAPHVENFLPVALSAVRIAMRILPREKIVGFLANLLGKLIANLVGPQQAPALSRAIVDAGLKLVSLEVDDKESPRLAASAVAATVEETLTRVASLPDHVLDNQELLEGFALEAFEQAAASNLPAVFSAATYKKRPELLEGGVNAAWIMLPLRRPRYKRCSRTYNVKITPHMAEAIETFEDAPLSEYFQDQLGIAEGEDVEAELHLFEVIPGGTAADIARNETETPGLGAADEVTLAQLQPLTHEAASVLLGKPGLGRKLWPGSDVRRLVPGQRVFHMVVGRRPLAITGPRGRPRVRRLVRLHVFLDTVRNEARVNVFLSEVTAQRLAVRLRQQSHAGSLGVAFRRLLARRLTNILHGRRPHLLQIVHPGVAPGAASAALLGRLPAIVPQLFIDKMQEWLLAAFTEFAKTQAQAFLGASENPADGVTLVFTIQQPPGLKEIAQVITGKGPAAADLGAAIAKGTPPAVRVEAVPGHKRD
jgi:hypothetical protein